MMAPALSTAIYGLALLGQVGNVVSETSECHRRIVDGGQTCADADILCVGAGQEFPGIQSAIDAADPGDAICIRGGTYTFTGDWAVLTIAGGNDGNDADPIYLQSYPGELAVIQGAGSEAAWDGATQATPNRNQRLIVANGEYWDIGFLEFRYSTDHHIELNADHLRVHHNHFHNSWGMAITLGLNPDDDGDTSDVTIEHNRFHNARTFSSIAGAFNDNRADRINISYNLFYDNGFEPDGDEQGGEAQGDADAFQMFKQCFLGGQKGKQVLCQDWVMNYNIAWGHADDCYDNSSGGHTMKGNIAYSCGPRGRRGIKHFLRAQGPTFYIANLLVGNIPQTNEAHIAFEGRMEGDVGLFLYHNAETGYDNRGLSPSFGGEVPTADNFVVQNNWGWNTAGAEFHYTPADPPITASGNWDGDVDGDPELSSVAAFSIDTQWPAGATREEEWRYMWNQFFHAFRPAPGSPLIDRGTFVSAVHCPDPDFAVPLPLSPGWDDSCLHWNGAAPDTGPFEAFGEGIFQDGFESGDTGAWSLTLAAPSQRARSEAE